MDRHPVELELLALVEGELSRGAARALEAHLGTCAACRGAVEAQRAARALLRAAPAIDPLPPQQVQALVRALPAHPRPTPWWRSRPVLVLTPAIGLAVAVAVAVSLSTGTRQPQPTAGEAAPTAAAGAQTGPAAKAAPSGNAAPAAKAVPAAPSGNAAPSATVRAATAAPDAATGPGSPLAAVAGTAARVVAFLRARGIVATAQDGRVLVREADGPRARAALATLPSGPVRVLVR